MKLFVYTRTQKKKRNWISFGTSRTFIGYIILDDHLHSSLLLGR